MNRRIRVARYHLERDRKWNTRLAEAYLYRLLAEQDTRIELNLGASAKLNEAIRDQQFIVWHLRQLHPSVTTI